MKPKTSAVKFLLVDDREENLIALEGLLRRDGLEILQARSGDEALEQLLVHDVALAILDVQMPGMDGFALAELMRGAERSRHVPIIFLTAGPQDQARVFAGYDAGAVDFLFKPIDARILNHKAETFFQLHKQRQELAETVRLTETFVAAVGHDLKNPLSNVLMGADLLATTSADPETKKTATRIAASARRMRRIIDDLFDLARARVGAGIPLEPKRVDLGEIAKKAIAEVEPTLGARSIVVEAEGDLAGEWDGGRLEQVFSNLLTNAIRHGEPEGPITVRLLGRDDGVVIAVHNRGAIPAEIIPHVFDPYRSSLASRSRTEGLGLGLYIVHQIVVAHGGTIAVTSNPREGTTLRIELPRRGVR